MGADITGSETMDEHVMSSRFDETAWIARLGRALEAVAAAARPLYSLPPEPTTRSDLTDYSSFHRAGYRALAAQAKHDPEAARRFKDSNLWLRTAPTEAVGVLREHPLMKERLVGSGPNEAVLCRTLGKVRRADLKWLISCLAKLAVKEGGEEAAARWDRYLTAGANASLPAHEIIVVHGLVVTERFDLGTGAYLAPYRHAQTAFDLPEEPEPFPTESYPDAAALVRSLTYGPALARGEDDDSFSDVRIGYRFPTDYRIDLKHWFGESKFLVDLLSIAARCPLLSRTRYVRLAEWIQELDPNFAFHLTDSGGFVSDMWPRGGEIGRNDIDAFVELSGGTYTYPEKPGAMKLAIRRLAGSFSRPGGRFGEEDRILDVAIALEVLYGGKTGRKLAPRAAGLLGASAAEQIRIFDEARRFYGVRSDIVHWKKPTPAHDVLPTHLKAGRDLACRTLAALVNRQAELKWADVMASLKPETQAHIDATRRQ